MRPFLIGIVSLFIVGLCLLLGAFSGCAAGGWLGTWIYDNKLTTIGESLSAALAWGMPVGIVGAILGILGGIRLARRIVPNE